MPSNSQSSDSERTEGGELTKLIVENCNTLNEMLTSDNERGLYPEYFKALNKKVSAESFICKIDIRTNKILSPIEQDQSEKDVSIRDFKVQVSIEKQGQPQIMEQVVLENDKFSNNVTINDLDQLVAIERAMKEWNRIATAKFNSQHSKQVVETGELEVGISDLRSAWKIKFHNILDSLFGRK